MRPKRSVAVAGATLAVGLLVLAGPVSGVLAARSAIIEIAIDFDTDPATERFTADSPLLCDEGDAFTDFHFGAGNFSAAGTFHLNKELICDDGSGSFVIKVNAASNFVVGDGTVGGWSVVPGSGTGDYVGLNGGGNIVGINQASGPAELIDYYYGRVGL